MIVYQARSEVLQCIQKEVRVASTSSMAVRHPIKMCIRTEEQVLVLGQNLLDFKTSETISWIWLGFCPNLPDNVDHVAICTDFY